MEQRYVCYYSALRVFNTCQCCPYKIRLFATPQVFCALCEPIRKLKYCGNTTNLFKHLQVLHPRVYSDMKKQAKQSSTGGEGTSSSSKSIKECLSGYEKYNSDSPRAKELTKAVGYFIVKDLMPTSVVQGDGFHKLIERLDPRYQLPSRKTFSDRVIPTMYNSLKDSKVLPGLKEAKYISLTIDC